MVTLLCLLFVLASAAAVAVQFVNLLTTEQRAEVVLAAYPYMVDLPAREFKTYALMAVQHWVSRLSCCIASVSRSINSSDGLKCIVIIRSSLPAVAAQVHPGITFSSEASKASCTAQSAAMQCC